MRLKHTGIYNSSQANVPSNFERINLYDKTLLTYDKVCKFTIDTPNEHEPNQTDKIQVEWFLTIFYQNTGIFEFSSAERFSIEDAETEPIDEDLKQVIIATYKYLQKSFNERRKEFKLFDALEDIHPDTIEQLLPQLREVAFSQLIPQ